MANTLNLGNVKTPGVYVDEMSLFPPSVAQVDTAIPVFIGPTALTHERKKAVRVNSMAEYRSLYGGAPNRKVTVDLDSRNGIVSVKQDVPDGGTNLQYLHDSLLLYFSNGGEKCYVVSTGTYSAGDAPSKEYYKECIDGLEKFDEPTLIVIPDAVNLASELELGYVQQAALAHCRKMQDRFTIMDVRMPVDATKADNYVTLFRNNVGSENLNYGAAYFPYVQTTIPLSVSATTLTIKKNGVPAPTFISLIPGAGTAETAAASAIDNIKTVESGMKAVVADIAKRAAYSYGGTSVPAYTGNVDALRIALTKRLEEFTLFSVPAALNTDSLNAAYTTAKTTAQGYPIGTSTIEELEVIYTKLNDLVSAFYEVVKTRLRGAEVELRAKSPLYAAIAQAAETQAIVLPPSGAIAGIYARTDANRGVWKSPANTSLNYVSGPIVALTDTEQDDMNVDTGAGKSVNAIRAFSGKGTLVWGARTLAGSDNEWRYISVRRFFLMAEESIRKATAQFVFESNDANTWVRVRAMIENFLTLQWRAGALAGAKADQAFFVRVGLGQTMTPQDVLNGFMIIEIGMAAVRPAEFIVLRFSHKMQEA